MGLFRLLFGKNKRKAVTPAPAITVNFETSEDDYFYDDIYYQLLRDRPKIVDYYGRPFDFPKYSDTFTTMDGHTLREWLLFVWWGKTKNGRKKDITIPKYFFTTYNLNAERLTAGFKQEGLLEDTEEKTVLTEKGRTFYNKYLALWDIHSVKKYPTNLDFDFPTWNAQQMEINLYKMEIAYLSDNLHHTKKIVERLNKINKPQWNKHIQKELEYYLNQSNSDLSRLNDLKQKLEVLIEKQNTLE